MNVTTISLDALGSLNIKKAEAIVGGLSKPSKMPSMGTSLPATECKVGAKLRKVAGSVCEKCYAMKGCYSWNSTKNALARRLEALSHPRWVEAMTFLINNKKVVQTERVFRWHDSGDIQSVDHLLAIIAVARNTPNVKHWIPTKEKGIVAKVSRMVEIPANLIIRVSGAMVDGSAPKGSAFTSTVTTNIDAATCRAFQTEKVGSEFRTVPMVEFTNLPKKHGKDLGHCGACRKCWDKEVKSVAYHKH